MANRIIVNLDTSKSQYNIYECKQNDDLILEASIFENGIEKDVTTKAITINCTRSDGTYVVQNTDITRDKNKITANLKRDFTRVDGLDKLEIVLLENEKQNTTFDFNILVKPSVLKTAVEESKDTVIILEELGNKIVEAGQVKAQTEELIATGGAATKGDIATVNSQLDKKEDKENVELFKNEVNLQIEQMARKDCVWVESWGSDTTGQVNKMNKPFATIDKALEMLPNGGNVYIGIGRFKSPSYDGERQYSKIDNNHNFYGSGMPVWNEEKTKMVDGSGTILEGTFIMINKNNNICKDFGVDVGEEVCNRLYNGVPQDGFVSVTVWNRPTTLLSPNTGKHFENISTIAKDKSSLVHSFLCEGVYGATVDNIKTCYGTHGIVFKSIKSNISNLQAFESEGEGLIVRSSPYAICNSNNFTNIQIENSGGITLDVSEEGMTINDNNFSNIVMVNVSYGIRDLVGNNSYCHKNHFNNVNINGVANYVFNINGKLNTFSNVDVANSIANGIMSNGEYNKFINVRVDGSPVPGAKGLINRNSNSFNSVSFGGGYSLIPFEDDGNANFVDTYNVKPLTLSSGMSALHETNSTPSIKKVSEKVFLEGQITYNSNLTNELLIATLPLGYRPQKNKRFLVPTNTGYMTVRIDSVDGCLRIENVTSGTWFSLDSVYFSIN